MIASDTINRMLVEVALGKPHTVTEDGAAEMYATLEKEVAEIRARGLEVEIPYEVPDLD